MTYLSCPSCRMTVRADALELHDGRCPRCRARTGQDVAMVERDGFVREHPRTREDTPAL
jgi:hypothetical protein